MLDSDFWRDLAEQFRAIRDPRHELRADWVTEAEPSGITPSAVDWHLNQPQDSPLIRDDFEVLARRGGPKIHPYVDSLVGWLEALRSSGMNRGMSGQGIRPSATGRRRYTGTIERVCEASVRLCKKHESIALETERMERVQREAGSWKKPVPPQEQSPSTPRKRGRPPISDALKHRAQEIKNAGGSNKDAAVEIYGTKYPTPQQVKNVPTILRHFRQRMKKSTTKPKKRS